MWTMVATEYAEYEATQEKTLVGYENEDEGVTDT